MLFVKRDDLKVGMRLARPIYNKNGVLLYDRNSKLTTQGIESIKNFGLIGIFILEPAEPAPPMTQEDIEFERFQTMCVYSIQEELDKIIQKRRTSRMQVIAGNIIKNYGHLDKKINFVQNLRSKEDYLYKHSLNVALLSVMMSHELNMMVEEQMETVYAAIVHDIGKLTVPREIMDKPVWDDDDREKIKSAEVAGYELVDDIFSSNPNVKRICAQAQKMLESIQTGEDISNMKLVNGAKVLVIAETFDTMTAMQFEQEPESEVAALKYLMEHETIFDPRYVTALTQCINILSEGVSVELNTGEKALVLTANERNLLRPIILMFGDNAIIDLSNESVYGDLEIKDIMKTMDNRHVMVQEMPEKAGETSEETNN